MFLNFRWNPSLLGLSRVKLHFKKLNLLYVLIRFDYTLCIEKAGTKLVKRLLLCGNCGVFVGLGEGRASKSGIKVRDLHFRSKMSRLWFRSIKTVSNPNYHTVKCLCALLWPIPFNNWAFVLFIFMILEKISLFLCFSRNVRISNSKCRDPRSQDPAF